MTVTLTYDKIAAAIIFVAVLTLTGLFYPIDSPLIAVTVASIMCIPGLVLVWFSDDLAETPCFPRGVPRLSPPGFISAMGWLFLVGYPALLFYAAG